MADFLTTLKVADYFPSDLTHGRRDECLTQGIKIIHFLSRLYAHYRVKL